MSVPFIASNATKLANSVQIRLAHLADAPAIATIHVDGWRVAYRGIMPEELLESLDPDEVTVRWIERIQSQASRIYVAETNGEVVGWASFCSLPDTVCCSIATRRCRCELMGLYLAPNHWRKGYGTLLYQTGEYDCRWVLAKNYGARLFYKKHGYRWTGMLRMPEYGDRACVTLQYWKSLTGNW
jgi:GNAT superfamily N-acetyltransferase